MQITNFTATTDEAGNVTAVENVLVDGQMVERPVEDSHTLEVMSEFMAEMSHEHEDEDAGPFLTRAEFETGMSGPVTLTHQQRNYLRNVLVTHIYDSEESFKQLSAKCQELIADDLRMLKVIANVLGDDPHQSKYRFEV